MGRYTVSLKVRVTPEEQEELLRRAGEGGYRHKSGNVNLSAYLRSVIFSAASEEAELKKGLKNLQYELRKTGVNVNQVARKINSGFGDYRDIRELKEYLARMEDALSGLREEIRRWQSRS